MVEPTPAALPYCGAPPSPDSLWSRWNFDPVLIATLLLLAGLYVAGARRAGLRRGERAAFLAGWAIAAAALTSPLCALSVALFAARVGQHMVLALLAAPLIAAGNPLAALRGRREGARMHAPLPAIAAFAVLLWFWHAPLPYALTFASSALYWTMHASMLGAAIWLWGTLLDRSAERVLAVVGGGAVSCVQMSLLGALVTFAPHPLYAPHALTTAAWGLSPLADQELGGAIMWVPGGVIFLVVAMLALRPVLTETLREAAG